MKLDEAFQLMETKGTYAALKLDSATKNKIKQWAKENKLPNPTNPEKYHVTLLYSRKYLPDYVAAGDLEIPYKGTPSGFDVWNTTPEDPSEPSTRALVLKFDCPELVKRHRELMDKHEATYDYPEYKTHITLSYDIGDIEVDDIPVPNFPIYLSHEYSEPLDLNWAKTKGVEKK